MEVRVLGPLEVIAQERDLTPRRPKQRALLALLALREGEPVPRDELIEALWGAEPPPTAAKALQGHVAALRARLGREAIETRGPAYALRLGSDVGHCERLAAAARAASDPARRAELLCEALAVFRGPPLADFRYEAFARDETARLDELRVALAEDRAEAELELGRHRELVPELERLVTAHPLRERLRGRLMLALYRSGRQADALAAFRAGRRLLVDELGIEPGPELRALEGRILAQDPALAPPAAGDPSATATTFVGRERELADLRALLAEERLVTVHGPGGSGKTRLAQEAAAGAAFAGLSAVTDAALVWPVIAAALGIAEAPGQPVADAVVEALAGRSALLILDNCEHVLDGARAAAEVLLARCPGVRLLATSREPLDAGAERVWPIPELTTDDAVRLFAERGARALPGYRVADAATVARICRRLDGMPLAVELAAARLDVLSPEQIDERLADRFRLLTRGRRGAPERHRTLRAAVDWSYEMLGAPERAALAQCSVFAGGFDADAAEQVLDGDALELLGALAARSFLARADAQGRARFRLHETIRAYAAERLEDADRVAARHLEWYAGLLEEADDALRGPEQAVWMQRLASDQDNVRRALAWGLAAPGAADRTLDVAWHMWQFWGARGRVEESERWLRQALERTAGRPPTVARTRAVTRLAEVLEHRGEYAAARAGYEEALAMGRELENPVREGVALIGLGDVDLGAGRLDAARERFEAAAPLLAGDPERARWPLDGLGRLALVAGEPERARELFERSRAAALALGNEAGVAEAVLRLGEAAHQAGERVAARGRLEEALGLARRTGEGEVETLSLLALGRLAADAGSPEAQARLRDALRLAHEAGRRPLVADCLEAIACAGGDPERTACLLGAAAALRERLGCPAAAPDRVRTERALAGARDALGDEALAAALGRGRGLGIREAVDFALGAGQPGW